MSLTLWEYKESVPLSATVGLALKLRWQLFLTHNVHNNRAPPCYPVFHGPCVHSPFGCVPAVAGHPLSTWAFTMADKAELSEAPASVIAHHLRFCSGFVGRTRLVSWTPEQGMRGTGLQLEGVRG